MTVYADTLADHAHQAYLAGRHAEAEALLRLVIAAGGRTAHAVYFLGHLCYLQGRLPEATLLLSTALELDPNNGRAQNDLGEALRAQGRNEEAIHHFERAVALEPRLAHPYGNLAAALVAVGRPQDALRWAQESLWRASDKAVAHCDLGSVLGRLGRHKEALRQFQLSLELRPEDPRPRYFESLMRLVLGDLPAAWEAHESRLLLPLGFLVRRQDSHPAWRGEIGIQGRVILLHAEQGLGDTIQFVRYAPLVAEHGATVLLEVQPGLRALLNGMPGVTAVHEQGDALPEYDLQCALMSLPAAFRTGLDTIPARIPYLSPRPDRLAAWQRRLGPWQRMRIGLAWSGSPAHANDRNRSISLVTLAGLLGRADVEWHVIQRDIRDDDRAALEEIEGLVDHAPDLTDFGETAALVSQMDLVITVDTALAHLAGALGKPGWVMLAHAPDWRWMTGRADSPWYPTLRLFRQPKAGDWAAVVQDIRHQLDLWAVPRG
jgi:tetratricopeptide (TPR) repeat protein